MGYQVEWIDQQRNIVKAELTGCFSPSEVSGLKKAIRPIADGPSPTYVLLDISKLDLTSAPMRLLAAFDGIDNATINRHLVDSQFAIVGGGRTIASLIQMYSSLMTSNNPTKLFDDEKSARDWLTAQADKQPIKAV